MPHLELKDLTQQFGSQRALDGLNLSIEKGELVSLLGPSGCGKTTTIRLIAGFLQPTAGSVWIDGRDVTPLPPERRRIGMVFQSYALFPHLDVYENVAFGLRAAKMPRRQVESRVHRALELVNLPNHAKRAAFELSGGEQQRVAIARAVAIEPQILLLDEPLSNLDASLRERTRRQLRELITLLGMTTVFVTHDQEEAFALSDRIALLSQGQCQQFARAQELYDHPANEFVARFIGRANIFSLPLGESGGDCLKLAWPSGRELRLRRPADSSKFGLKTGESCKVLLRPEKVGFEERAGTVRLFPARLLSHRFAGAWTEWEAEAEGVRFWITQFGTPLNGPLAVGMIRDLWVRLEDFQLLEA
jgi:ABC-type Fe3+/spermidine/putrescine transport system ATPase subunit